MDEGDPRDTEARSRHRHGLPRRRRTKQASKELKRSVTWAGGILVAGILGLVATGVIPKVVSQFVNGASIEDSLRPGPDISINESMFYPDGPSVPIPTVASGNYRPSSQLVRALGRPMAVTSAAVERQIRQSHGVDVEDIFIRTVLQSDRNQRILVLNVQPVQVERSLPLNGTLFAIGGQGEDPNIQMGFNLDKPDPQAVNVVGQRPTNTPYFEGHSISLDNGEEVVLIVEAETECFTVKFKLAVDYLIGGADKQEVISNHGKPFEVTAFRYGHNNIMSYKHIFALQGNFSATQPSPSELARSYRQTEQEARSCPTG